MPQERPVGYAAVSFGSLRVVAAKFDELAPAPGRQSGNRSGRFSKIVQTFDAVSDSGCGQAHNILILSAHANGTRSILAKLTSALSVPA